MLLTTTTAKEYDDGYQCGLKNVRKLQGNFFIQKIYLFVAIERLLLHSDTSLHHAPHLTMQTLRLIMILAFMMAAISSCIVSAETTEPPEKVRLQGGSKSSEGRVEVFLDGQWGTVCNNLWTLREANVVCIQLGYVGADNVFYDGYKFGEGVGDILLRLVQCEGTEQDLLDCRQGVSAGPPCDHSEDVGVECTTTNSLRLANGNSYREGRLEMLDENGQWGTVCAQDWDIEDTRVACRQLERRGTELDNLESFTAAPGSGPIVTGGLQCEGDENRLDNCTQAADWTPESCDPGLHGQEIGVSCNPGINLDGNGLIILYHGGVSGTICPGDNWDQNAASVACRDLGHKGVKESMIVEFDSLQVIMSNPRCSGDETFYTECEYVEWAYQGDCAPGTGRAAVICDVEEPEIKISNDSPYPEIGRVEISLTDPSNYMAICDSTWDIAKAHLVCRQLGYSGGAVQVFSVGDGTDQVITDLECPDGAASLADCTFETMEVEKAENCNIDQVAGVVCLSSAEDSLVPLVSGGSTSEGVLEYKISGLPALICDPDWSDREATVACRMHGYEMGNATKVVNLTHSRDSFPYSFQKYNFTCLGSEASLADCQMEAIESVEECSPDDIVQVTCQPYKDLDLRLVGSPASEQGRVEVFLGGEWASLTFNISYGIRDHLCQLLGYKEYTTGIAAAGDENPFGAGTGKVLKCSLTFPYGCEDVLTEVSDSEPRNDVGVVCTPYGTVENHPVRLVSETGVANNETGRVEILHDGEWGAICETRPDIYYNGVEKVVCRELGYIDDTDLQYANRINGADQDPFLTGSEKIWLSIDYYCTTSRLYACEHGPWGQHPDDCTPLVVTCVRADDDDDDDDDDNSAPGLLHAHQTSLIFGGVLMVLLVIAQ